MRKLILLLLISTALFSCSKDETAIDKEDPKEEPMSLKVVNNLEDYYYITSVKLVGYSFESLNLKSGQSQTFQLDKGMSGGFEDINVILNYRTSPHFAGWNTSASIDFNKSGVTTLTLQGCTAEGCDGIRLVQ